MPGYNHYRDCTCGWCSKLSSGRANRGFDSAAANSSVLLQERGYRLSSFSSCFVNPNANCPVCGAAVFYYENAHGSRVYFDDLGKPWPKHGCTDRGRGSHRGYQIRIPTERRPPVERRAHWEIEEILGLARHLPIDPREQRRQKYAEDPSTVLRVVRAVRRGFTNFVEAEELVGGEGETLFLRFESATHKCELGDLLSWDGEVVSVPDLRIDGGHRTFKAKLVAEAAFLEALGS